MGMTSVISHRGQKATEIQEGMWYRYHSINRCTGVSWKQWVKAQCSGHATVGLDFLTLGPVDEVCIWAETYHAGERYFIPASFEKAERLENQLARERKEKEMKGGKLWVAPPVMLLRL